MFTTADIEFSTTMTVEEAASLRVATIIMPCGGLLHFDSAWNGPEAGEVSLFAGTERYIFHADAMVEVASWKVGR